MSVAKGKLFVSTEQLQMLLQLPDGIEILALRPKAHSDGFEFLLVSTEESVLTHKNIPLGQIPKVDLELRVEYHGGVVESVPFPEVGMAKGETIISKSQAELLFDSVGNLEINTQAFKNNLFESAKPQEKSIKDSFEDILKMAQKKKGSF